MIAEGTATVWQRVRLALQVRTMVMVISAGCVPVGIIGTVLGPDSSRAFTIISAGPFIARTYGILLLVGGLLVFLSVALHEIFLEVLGLTAIAAGTALYGIGVYIGLGMNGLMAGSLALLIGLGAISRVMFLLALAKKS